MSNPFGYLITLEPLGLLYGSSGRFLSAENLVGQSGEHFPPDSPAVAGLIAAQLPRADLRSLHTAGPFWYRDGDLYVPAPLSLLQEGSTGGATTRAVIERLVWQPAQGEADVPGWVPASGKQPPAKPLRGGWIPLSAWNQQAQHQPGAKVYANPWKTVPHLHPRLRDDERVSAQDDALFMELSVALEPHVCLAYLSSHDIPPGRYRFGGEGHLVEVRSQPIPSLLLELMAQPLTGSFSLITPGLWGGSRLSRREPLEHPRDHLPWHHDGQVPALLTDRPRPWRHRLGAGVGGQARLSRGRWALPAGSCYHLPSGKELQPWPDWPANWFPKEGFSFKQLGTGLALPLP